MKKSIHWQRSIQRIFKNPKQLGADQLIKEFETTDFFSMQERIVSLDNNSMLNNIFKKFPQLSPIDNSNVSVAMSDKSDYQPKRYRDLFTHLYHLQKEFIGQSEINFYHAILIILIRRGYKVTESFQAFEQLWLSQTNYLLKSLSIRWLVSAADTFIDHSKDPLRRTILMNVVTLVNTVKAYETTQAFAANPTPNENHIEKLRIQHCMLFDGLTYFRIGTDDTLKNMRIRYETFNQLDPLATQILLVVFDRLHDNPTAFALLKQLHTDGKSLWW